MKRSAGRMFIKGLIQSFFIVAILLGTGILGYKLTMLLWQDPEEEAVVAYQEDTVAEGSMQLSMEQVVKNLIYCYDEETKQVTKVMLEIFQSEAKQLTYITIPMRTELNISDTLYRDLISIQPAMPQVLQLSAITSYLDSETVFDYGELIMEDLLGITINYYTVIPQAIYDTIFESKNIEQQLPVECFSKKYIKFLKTIKTEEEIEKYITELYQSLKSSLPLEDKLNYLNSYSLTPLSSISFELIKGNDTNSAFVIDKVNAMQRLEELTKESNSEGS